MKLTHYITPFAAAFISSIDLAEAGITVLNQNGSISVSNASTSIERQFNIWAAPGQPRGKLVTNYIEATDECDFNGVRVGRGSGNLFDNTAIGYAAMDGAGATGTFCTAVGSYAMQYNSSGAANTAVGHAAMLGNTSGVNNTASGTSALRLNSGGSYNTVMGMNAAYHTQGSSYNSAFGMSALYINVSGSENTAIGAQALHNNTANNNTGVGMNALLYNTTGHSNVAIGNNAGLVHANGTTPLTTTSGSIYIGVNSRGFSNADSNSIVIGAGAWGEGANTTVIGNGATVKTHLFGQTVTSSLKVDGATVLNGSVILAAPQGDISMGAYQ
jgi:hypothetical protein